jgi:Zn-dependent alcohol dehydrogenase
MRRGGVVMTTSEVLTEQALSLASAGAVGEEAVLELLTVSGERRVAVVRARQSLLARSAEQADDETTAQAVELLEAVLIRLPV